MKINLSPKQPPFRHLILSSTVIVLIYLTYNFYISYDSTVLVIGATRTVSAAIYQEMTLTAEATLAIQLAMQQTAQSATQAVQETSLAATQTALAPTITPSPTPTTTPTPLPGEQMVAPVDGMVRVYIPAGSFEMGRKGGDQPNRPRHTVFVDDFWISLTQVTNAMYARCVAAGVCSPPIREEINPHYYNPKYANHPAVYIVWGQAEAYCEWTGGRLPTEAEWERAASGDGHRAFAWGDNQGRSNAANIDNHHKGTTEVGTHPNGASPFGVLDMGGNVREWVWDWFDPRYYKISPASNPMGPEQGEKKVLRGASWHDNYSTSKVSNRLAHVPDSAGNNRGFRCVYP